MQKRLFSQLGTLLLAFGMAFLVWIAAIRENDPIVTRNFTQRVPVKIIQPADGLFVVDQNTLPTDVQVRIKAPQSVWQNLTLSRIRATLDLSGFDAGLHDVPIKIELLDRLAVVDEVIPSDVGVQLDALAEKILPVTASVLDSPAQGYFNKIPVLDPAEVTIRGSAEAVEQVATISAELSVDNSKETVERTVSLKPLDADGNVVKDITIDPARATITVPIDQRFGYKDVSVKANVVGLPASGYWVSSISVEPATVTLVGGPSVLGDVTGLVETAAIDVTGATEDVVKRVPLNLPPGASLVVGDTQQSTESRSVLVHVGISALTGGRTMQVGLTVQGVRQDLRWTAAPETVEAIFSGPLPILQDLKADDITAILDVFGLSAGVYRLQPELIYPDGLTITSLIPDTIEITLSQIQTPTPFPTAVPSGTPFATPTPVITVTVTPMLTDTITSTLGITETTVQPVQTPGSPVATPETN